MARSFGSQTPSQRRTAQRRLAKELKENPEGSPLGGKYREIVRKATVRGNRKRTYKNIHDRLHTYIKYDDDHVKFYVYQVMTEEDLVWGQTADTEELRERARAGQVMGDPYVVIYEDVETNVWWYH